MVCLPRYLDTHHVMITIKQASQWASFKCPSIVLAQVHCPTKGCYCLLITHPAKLVAWVCSAIHTSSPHTSYAHFRPPTIPAITLPVCTPTDKLIGTSVKSRMYLQTNKQNKSSLFYIHWCKQTEASYTLTIWQCLTATTLYAYIVNRKGRQLNTAGKKVT